MAGIKRKDAPRTSRSSGHNAAKKPKIESKLVKKSFKPSAEPDDLEESDTNEDDDFGVFSEGDNAGSSGTEDTDTDDGAVKAAKANPADEAMKTVKPNSGAIGASNCMQTICHL